MISNSRQAVIARKEHAGLLRAAAEAAPAARNGFLQLAAEIECELEEYDAIRGGAVSRFSVGDIGDLGEALVKARLARGWTHRQLAAALGVSEQAVQKDESRAYEHAGLARIAEVADVLGYSLEGTFQPNAGPVSR